MLEVKIRMASLGLFLAFFLVTNAYGEDASHGGSQAVDEVREIDRALKLAAEIQALNRGDFDARRGRFHPQFHMQLDEKSLSLSVNQN